MSLYQKQSVTQGKPKAGMLAWGKAKEIAGNIPQADIGVLSDSEKAARGPSHAEIEADKLARAQANIPEGYTFSGYDDQNRPKFTEAAPTTIGEVVDNTQRTYAEQADSIDQGSYLEAAENFENIFGRPAPFRTRDEYLAWRENQSQEDLDFLTQQQEYSRQIEKVQFDKAKEQIAGAQSGMTANMAQGREGAMSGTAPMFTAEFGEQMKQQVRQLEVEKASMEAQRQKQLVDYERAKTAGDMDLAQAIQGRIDSIEREIKAADDKSFQLALMGEQQALEAAKFQHSASMDTQATYRANLSVFQGMVQSGNQMDVNQISGMANSLGIPFDVANGYYESAQMIRDDKSLDFQAKQIALADLARDFDLKVQGVIGEKAQIVHGIMNMVKEGRMTQEEASQYLMAAKIDSSMNPLTQLDMKISSLDILTKQIGLKYLDAEKQQALTMNNQQISLNDLDLMIKNAKAQNAPEREILEMEKLRIELRTAELDKNAYEQSFANEIDETTAKNIFTLDKDSRFGHGYDKAECGEAYNDFTEGSARVGSTYKSKMAIVEKQDNPQVGNGLIIPLKAYYKDKNGKSVFAGHIETVISANNVTGEFQTVSYNRDGNGGKTIQTYNINDLKKKHGDNWGFSNSKLKQKYADKVPKDTGVSGGAEGIANTIMEGTTGMTLDDVPQKERAAVAEQLAKKKQQALESGDSIGYLRASAGGKQLGDTATQSLGKTQNVLSQLEGLESQIMAMDTGPIISTFRTAHPYDVDMATLKAQLQAIVPNLARGVYGEVGVLTDTDIKNYIQTLPNAHSTEDQKKALMAFTKNVIGSSIENNLKNYAMAGYDVSGYVPIIEQLKNSEEMDELNSYGGYYIPTGGQSSGAGFIDINTI